MTCAPRSLTTTCSGWTGSSTASILTKRSKLRDETRKILELPDLPISATCVRVPVVVGHAEAVWVETETPLSPADAEQILVRATGIRLEKIPSHGHAIGSDDVIVGRVRDDPAAENGLMLLPHLRQPAQGRGTERDPDRRAAHWRVATELLRAAGAEPLASVPVTGPRLRREGDRGRAFGQSNHGAGTRGG